MATKAKATAEEAPVEEAAAAATAEEAPVEEAAAESASSAKAKAAKETKAAAAALKDASDALRCAWCGKPPYDGDLKLAEAFFSPVDISAPPCVHCEHNPR